MSSEQIKDYLGYNKILYEELKKHVCHKKILADLHILYCRPNLDLFKTCYYCSGLEFQCTEYDDSYKINKDGGIEKCVDQKVQKTK